MDDFEKKTSILIVEDEVIIAADLENRLRDRGYSICGVTNTAQKAFEIIEQCNPDLVMMDIVLKGDMDGIDAAEVIRDNWRIPIVFLTAYADSDRLERAKLTCPFGYILKPFQDRELKITTEMALYVSKVDAERRKAEERCRVFFEKSKDAIFIAADDARFVEVNEAATVLTGYDRDALLEMKIPDLHDEIDQGAYREFFSRIMSGEPITSEAKIRRKDGSKVYTEFSNTRVKIDDAYYMHTVARDITERKTAQFELARIKEEFEGIFHAQQDAIFVLNAEMPARIIDCNKAAEDIFGYNREEILNRTTVFLHQNEETLKVFQGHLYTEIQKDGVLKLQDFRMKRKDGTMFPTEHHVLQRTDEKGERTGWLSIVRDISDRVETGRLLRENEQKYRHLFNHAPAGIYEIDFINNRITNINDAACHYSGYSREELMGMDPFSLLGEDSRSLFAQRMEAFRDGRPMHDNVEYEIITKSGDSLWALLSIRFNYENGRVTGASVVAHDVSERKITQRKLLESEKKAQAYRNDLELYARLTPLGIIVFDNEFKITSWNPGAEKIFGYSAQEAIGKSTFDILVPAYEHENVRRIHMITDPRVTININDNKTKDGEIITVEWFNAPRLDSEGNILGLVAACQDITEKIRIEKALLESENKYRITFDSIPDIITITRVADGRYSYVNDTFSEITGYRREEVIGLTPRDIDLYEKFEDRENMMRTLKENGQLLNYEVRFRKKDGTFFDSLFSAKPVIIDGENSLVALTKDVTKYKELENEKALLENQLQQAQKMEAIGTLAGGIAHDFNNLLQAINGYSQILLMDKTEKDPDYSNLKAVLEAGNRAKELVRQLLLFSRKVETERKPLELNHEVEQVRKILERTIPKMVEIEVKTAGRLPLIHADPVQIEQILLNLGTNAADAMPDGGKLVIETESVLLNRGYSGAHLGVQAGLYVLMTVSDTGCGITPEALPKIFEPFYTTKEIGKGTGLGLASVYGIVKSHGGHINCYSNACHGTVFKIYFPAIEQQADEDQAYESSTVPAGGTETILLVDDEKAIRDFAEQVLKKFGYTTITARRGEDALKIYSRHGSKIDLIMMDIGMPGMGGHQCLRELLKQNPDARIIIASGYPAHGKVKQTLESGAAGYVAKPYQITDLLEKIRKVLDRT